MELTFIRFWPCHCASSSHIGRKSVIKKLLVVFLMFLIVRLKSVDSQFHLVQMSVLSLYLLLDACLVWLLSQLSIEDCPHRLLALVLLLLNLGDVGNGLLLNGGSFHEIIAVNHWTHFYFVIKNGSVIWISLQKQWLLKRVRLLLLWTIYC